MSNHNIRSARIVYLWRSIDGPCEIRLDRIRKGNVEGEERDIVFLSDIYPLEMKDLVEQYARDWIEVGVREEGEFNFNGRSA